MSSVKVTLLGAVLAMAGGGCAATVRKPSATYASRAARPQPTEGRAAVYVIRPGGTVVGAAALYHLELDGGAFGILTNGTYLFAEVLPREHLLEMRRPRMAVLSFNPEAGRVYFFRLAVGMTAEFEALSPQEGRALLAETELSGDSAFDEGDEIVLPAATPPAAR